MKYKRRVDNSKPMQDERLYHSKDGVVLDGRISASYGLRDGHQNN